MTGKASAIGAIRTLGWAGAALALEREVVARRAGLAAGATSAGAAGAAAAFLRVLGLAARGAAGLRRDFLAAGSTLAGSLEGA